MTDRCEPPIELRGVDGRHWVRQDDGPPFLAAWEHPGWWPESGGAWRSNRHVKVPTAAYKQGWRYDSPVATPVEVAALRAERDRLEASWFDAIAERATAEARVAELEAALQTIERLDQAHPAATTDRPDWKLAAGSMGAIARAALGGTDGR